MPGFGERLQRHPDRRARDLEVIGELLLGNVHSGREVQLSQVLEDARREPGVKAAAGLGA